MSTISRARGGSRDGAAALRSLRPRLAEAGYTAEALTSTLGIAQPDDIGLLNHASALERIRDDRAPAATLMRLFCLEGEETESRVAAALSPELCDGLIGLGLLRRRGGALSSQVRIDPVGDQYFAADRRFRAMAPTALRLPGRDPVYPPSSDSLMLRQAIVAPRARRVLDLCTGSGVQALRHAHSAERILAVDLNPRAAAMARLNARFNGADHVDVRVGDLYGPVGGERFDLIIANPPFVVSPYRCGPSYHAGGALGDSVLRRVIAGWATHLDRGGRAFAVTHRALRGGEEIDGVTRSWFRRFPGRALVLVLERGTAVDLAAAQALFALRGGLAAYAREVRRWVDHLHRLRVRTVALLLIVAERGDRQHFEVVEARPRILPIPLTPSAADRIAAWLG